MKPAPSIAVHLDLAQMLESWQAAGTVSAPSRPSAYKPQELRLTHGCACSTVTSTPLPSLVGPLLLSRVKAVESDCDRNRRRGSKEDLGSWGIGGRAAEGGRRGQVHSPRKI